jgi:hypothetical protein
VSHLTGTLFGSPWLRFDPAVPSRQDTVAYRGMSRLGPYSNSNVALGSDSVMFVFPEHLQGLASAFAKMLIHGHRSYPGFGAMFGVKLDANEVLRTFIRVPTPPGASAATATPSYRDAITKWTSRAGRTDPDIAFVVIPRSDRWDVDRPYYEAKAKFAQLGVPTQMVTAELLADERRLAWALANIALQAFAKLGGVPWAVQAPAGDSDLILGVGRRDLRTAAGVKRIFGYAMSFTSNGLYRQTWSFTPAAGEDAYAEGITAALREALDSDYDVDAEPERVVIHLSKKTGRREVEAAKKALAESGRRGLPLVLLRIDDSSIYDLMDLGQDTFAPPRGLAVRLGPRRALLQAEGLGELGPSRGALLVELDRRSDVGPEALPALVHQVYRLCSASWRGFRSTTKPVTLAYGEELAELVGYLEELESWTPSSLPAPLLKRPWFL